MTKLAPRRIAAFAAVATLTTLTTIGACGSDDDVPSGDCTGAIPTYAEVTALQKCAGCHSSAKTASHDVAAQSAKHCAASIARRNALTMQLPQRSST